VISHRPALRVTILREIPDDFLLREQWNALVLQTQSPQVFYTYEWARAVQFAYGQSLCPLLMLGRDDNQGLVGVAALAAPSGGPVSFLCANTGDYCDFVVNERQAAVFATLVVDTLRQQSYRDIVLTNFPEDSPCYAALHSAARSSGFHIHARTAYVCSQVRLSTMDVNANGKPALPRQKMVRRSLRAIGEAAPPVMTRETKWEEIHGLLPDFFRAHVARFLFTDRISNLVRPERRQFLSELAHLLSPAGWLCLSRMNAGPRTVSWNYGFEFRATWFWYQPTFVNDLEKYSPGFVLLSKLIEEAAQNPGVESVDLGLGAEAYKEAFANAGRRTMYVTLHRSLAKHWIEMARYQAATALAARPAAEQAARGLVARADALRTRLRRDGVKSTLAWFLSRLRGWFFSREEVFFYDLTNPNGALPESDELFLKTIDFDLLADAAMQNANDEGTLAYLLRCARRLRMEPDSVGFALTNPAGEFLHFTWAGPFENFYWSELSSRLPSPSHGSMVLFDSWTPVSQRGRGYYGPTLSRVVARIRREGKRAWGFSASTNTSSVRGLEKAGFQRCFSVFRYRCLWWQKIVQRNTAAPAPSTSSRPV